jgi:hypothetical protein
MNKEVTTQFKVLGGVSLLCLLVAFGAVLGMAWMREPGNTLPFDPKPIFVGSYGLYLVLQSIMNWKERRALAVFYLACVLGSALLIAYFTLR